MDNKNCVWMIYLRNFGQVHCATEEDALAIRAEFLVRNPAGSVTMPERIELATPAAFFVG